jgi:hypothetical protein
MLTLFGPSTSGLVRLDLWKMETLPTPPMVIAQDLKLELQNDMGSEHRKANYNTIRPICSTVRLILI